MYLPTTGYTTIRYNNNRSYIEYILNYIITRIWMFSIFWTLQLSSNIPCDLTWTSPKTFSGATSSMPAGTTGKPKRLSRRLRLDLAALHLNHLWEITQRAPFTYYLSPFPIFLFAPSYRLRWQSFLIRAQNYKRMLLAAMNDTPMPGLSVHLTRW